MNTYIEQVKSRIRGIDGIFNKIHHTLIGHHGDMRSIPVVTVDALAIERVRLVNIMKKLENGQ